MKKLRLTALALTGALTLSLVLSACGGDKPADSVPPTDSPVISESVKPSETPEESVDPNAPASTPGSSEDPETQPSEKPSTPSAKPSEKPVGTHPAVTPAPSDAPAEDTTDKVAAVWTGISALDLPSFMDLDADTLTALYGISADDLETYVGKVPMMNVQATEFYIAKVKSGKMDTVKAGIAKRQADLVKEWEQYLPEQLELVKNYQLVTNGDYVMFAVSSYGDQVVEIFNNCTK